MLLTLQHNSLDRLYLDIASRLDARMAQGTLRALRLKNLPAWMSTLRKIACTR
jgi:hypothetical protein